MRTSVLRNFVAAGAVVGLAAGLTLPSAGAAQAAASARRNAVLASGPHETMIVVLRNQNRSTPAASAARAEAVRAEQRPLLSQMQAAGARHVVSVPLVNVVIASITPREAAYLKASPAVESVSPNATVPGPVPYSPSGPMGAGSRLGKASLAAGPCGTKAGPLLTPEALTNIHATPADLKIGGTQIDGAGVTVSYMADGIDTSIADFRRNAAFASTGSPAGSPVVTQKDFSTDGTNAVTPGGEAFLDASSIGAQGYEASNPANTEFDLSKSVNGDTGLPSGCFIQVVGASPGASVLGLKVFAQNNDTTTSGFLQAINYAVSHGVKVLNESFGSNNFPDTALDVVREADDAAVRAGVTVVTSTGDGGFTNTIGSPATDANVISVGASTTFQGYQQANDGGIHGPAYGGTVVDNNISSLSSGGYDQSGGTLDLVAPGDLNWTLCGTAVASGKPRFTDCQSVFNGVVDPVQLSGGTSESAPLTSAAAADVIQAYSTTHGGKDPSPALVKQILMSTATDIDAPAVLQGAGLLNVAAAVKLAESIKGTSSSARSGVLVSPGQVNVVAAPGTTTAHTISVTNTGTSAATVHLSTRAITHRVGTTSGSFCMQPGAPTSACPANTGAFSIWSGVTEVYQDETFKVPATTGVSRLVFAADYPFTGQTSLLHFALFEPDGAYAAYSVPQGLGDYGQVGVADPPAGTWTAEFFTEQDGATPGGVGTSGTVQWAATTYGSVAGGSLSTHSLTIGPGATGTASLNVATPAAAGDTSQSVVIAGAGNTTTIPVTVRTTIPIGKHGGSFRGVLTGGNGRAGTQAEQDTYAFQVPAHKRDLNVSVALATDPQDVLLANLVGPSGQTLAYSSNITTDNFGTLAADPFVDLYVDGPAAGTWRLLLAWQNPVTGLELTEPFTGVVGFNQVSRSSDLPHSSAVQLERGKSYIYKLTIDNNGVAPEAYFADPRLDTRTTLTLPNANPAVNASDMKLPLPAGLSFPYYFVPPQSTALEASLTGSAPVSFDMEYYPGDPDVSPEMKAPGVSGSRSGDSSSLTLTEPQVSPGMWLINPDEIGPYPASGAPSVKASAMLRVVTKAFDPSMQSSTGDFWSLIDRVAPSSFTPQYVPSGDSTTITLTIKPTAPVGSVVHGTAYVDAFVLGSFFFGGPALGNADELAAVPYTYKVVGS